MLKEEAAPTSPRAAGQRVVLTASGNDDLVLRLKTMESKHEQQLHLLEECLSGISKLLHLEKAAKRRECKSGFYGTIGEVIPPKRQTVKPGQMLYAGTPAQPPEARQLQPGPQEPPPTVAVRRELLSRVIQRNSVDSSPISEGQRGEASPRGADQHSHGHFNSANHFAGAIAQGAVGIHLALTKQITCRKMLWQGLEDSSSSWWAATWAFTVTCMILMGVANSWIELVYPDFGIAPYVTFVLQAIFATELLVRFVCCPVRRLFLFNAFNIIDLMITSLSAAMLFLVVSRSKADETLLSMRIFFPTLTLLKLLRRFRTFHLLLHAFEDAVQALPVLLYTEIVIVLAFAAIIYVVEPRETVGSMQDSLWFCIVTIATVGYGDISPTTSPGKIATTFLIVLGTLYMAVPIGIVGKAFSNIWDDRERLKILLQMREYISWAGYSRDDVRAVFEALDSNGDHQLNFEEFREILPLLNIHLGENLAQQVFQAFDDDGEGSIDFNEFLCGVFPAQRFFRWGGESSDNGNTGACSSHNGRPSLSSGEGDKDGVDYICSSFPADVRPSGGKVSSVSEEKDDDTVHEHMSMESDTLARKATPADDQASGLDIAGQPSEPVSPASDHVAIRRPSRNALRHKSIYDRVMEI